MRSGLVGTGGPEHQPLPHVLGAQGQGPRKYKGTEDAGLGGGPTLRTPKESAFTLPALPLKQKERGVELPGWGRPSLTLTPRTEKLRKAGQTLGDSCFEKGPGIFRVR